MGPETATPPLHLSSSVQHKGEWFPSMLPLSCLCVSYSASKLHLPLQGPAKPPTLPGLKSSLIDSSVLRRHPKSSPASYSLFLSFPPTQGHELLDGGAGVFVTPFLTTAFVLLVAALRGPREPRAGG